MLNCDLDINSFSGVMFEASSRKHKVMGIEKAEVGVFEVFCRKGKERNGTKAKRKQA